MSVRTVLLHVTVSSHPVGIWYRASEWVPSSTQVSSLGMYNAVNLSLSFDKFDDIFAALPMGQI